MNVDQEIAEAKVYYEDGKPIVEWTTCGNCGRSWNNAAASRCTPTHGPRCPWEMDDEHPCWKYGDEA